MIEDNCFNSEQIKAITTKSQYVRVIAGAGSGKTLVLMNRIIFLINELKIDPNKILALTFTNKAANEMQDRISKFSLVKNIILQISTFHSFCLKFLREEISFLKIDPCFTIFDSEDTKKVIVDINKKNNFNCNIKEVINYISDKKQKNNHFRFIGKEKEIDYLFIFNEYEKFKLKNNALDFDDLIIKTIEILSSSIEIRKKWLKLISHILIDEFQDTNNIQFELIKLISDNSTSIYVVGDPNQTIYSWRGANQKNIIDFDKNYNNVETIFLNQNYRSTDKILDVANKLISHNKDSFSKEKLFTKNTNGDDVKLFLKKNKTSLLSNNISESEYVVSEIIKLKNQKNINLKNIAILYRSSYLTIPFEKELIKNKIPYHIFGGINFFQRKEIKDVLSYFRLIINPNDSIAFERIINVPKRKIGEKSVNVIKNISENENISFYECIKKIKNNKIKAKLSKLVIDNLFNLIQRIEETKLNLINNKNKTVQIIKDFLHQIGYFEYLKENDTSDKIKNLDSLFESIDETVKKSGNDLNFWLQNFMLNTSHDEIKNGEFVSLMTIHMAKGLEFDYVFVVGLNHFDFPHIKNYDSLEEERRLCYVAYTRAKKMLFISSKNINSASCFIEESGFKIQKNNNFNNKRFNFFEKNNDEFVFDYEIFTEKNKIKEETDNNGIHDWKINDKLVHERFGKGIVIEVLEENIIVVKFDNYGLKKMIANHIMIKKL